MSCCSCNTPGQDGGPAEPPEAGRAAAPEITAFRRWWRLGICVLLGVWSMLLALAINTSEAEPATVRTIHAVLAGMAGIAMALLGWPLVVHTARSLRRGRLTIEPLFVSALLGATVYSSINAIRGEGPVYFETVIVVLVIYSIGTQIKGGAQSRATAVLRAMAGDQRTAHLVRGGRVVDSPVDAIRAGDLIEARPGEAIPADGTIESGTALIDTASITGEPFPESRGPGDNVAGGSYSIDGMLRIRVAHDASDSLLSRATSTIGRDLVERAQAVSAANRVLKWFIPAVWAVSLATFGGWTLAGSAGQGLMHALAVLLVACPCALGFAAPTAVWAALTRLTRHGLRVEDADIVEGLASARVAMFDKTGTVTSPAPVVERFRVEPSAHARKDRIRAWVSAIERRCEHPLARPLRALTNDSEAERVSVGSVRLLPGRGLEAEIEEGDHVHLVTIARDEALDDSTLHTLRVEIDGVRSATIGLRESALGGWPEIRRSLAELGLQTVIVTGDAEARAVMVEADRWHAGTTPAQKRELVMDERGRGGPVLFVGDGINDAPAIALADASIAVTTGTPLTNAAAQASLDPARLASLPEMVSVARRASGVLRTNVAISIAYNTAGMSVAAAGLLHPALAAVLMVVSSLVVTARALSVAEERPSQPRSQGRGETEAPRTAPIREAAAPNATPVSA